MKNYIQKKMMKRGVYYRTMDKDRETGNEIL